MASVVGGNSATLTQAKNTIEAPAPLQQPSRIATQGRPDPIPADEVPHAHEEDQSTQEYYHEFNNNFANVHTEYQAQNTQSDSVASESDEDTITPGFDGTNKLLYYVYAIFLITVCILCLLGLAAWFGMNDFGKTSIARMNLLDKSCFNQEGCTTPTTPKTHQCMHAFAWGYQYESMQVQTPFLPMSTATKDDVIKSMLNDANANTAVSHYDVLDLCNVDAAMTRAYAANNTEAKKHIISCLQTEEFCPKEKDPTTTEACTAWYSRIDKIAKAEKYENKYRELVDGNKDNLQNDVWSPFPVAEMADGYPCRKFDKTYKEHADYALDICKMMRTPRMALAHLQNNEYNLFSAQNEMCLAVCLNAVILVFSFTYCIHLLRDFFRSDTSGDRCPALKNGVARIFVAVPAVIVITATLSMMTQKNATAETKKDGLMPTGSVIIAVISGGLAVVLAACAPFYKGVYVDTDEAKKNEGTALPNAGIYTNTSEKRFHRFLRSRNDLLIAYCNFLTFPILVLLIYVRYNWYSIDTHVQRAFFSAVAVGVLDITEVSVMGALYLVTEFEDFSKRKEAVGNREAQGALEKIWFRHSNVVNFAAQMVFFLSKMAVFIPTITQIRQNLAWVHHAQGTEQFRGQKEGTQPLVGVMIAFFAINHVVALLENIFYNLGFFPNVMFAKFDSKSSCFDWGHGGKFNFRLVMFAIMNISVVSVINFTKQ